MVREFAMISNVPPLQKEDFQIVQYIHESLRLLDGRIWDSVQTNITTAGNDDLGVAGTNAIYLTTASVQGAAATRHARFMFVLPSTYIAGNPVRIAVCAGILDAVATTKAEVDVTAYREDNSGVATSDICITSAQSVNSVTKAFKYFSLNPATLIPGDRINLRVTLDMDDTGGGDACTAIITDLAVQYTNYGG